MHCRSQHGTERLAGEFGIKVGHARQKAPVHDGELEAQFGSAGSVWREDRLQPAKRGSARRTRLYLVAFEPREVRVVAHQLAEIPRVLENR